ncbi:STAS domain-containing protein [Streptomyces smyrnaeus]|uniref:STAS domain-containing protein n=2 Tax=Streptomyces TaxID=1883 RepID=UPI0033EAB441
MRAPMAPHPDESGRRLSSTEREEPCVTADEPMTGHEPSGGDEAWAAGDEVWDGDEEMGPAGTVLTRTEHGRTVVELQGEIDLAVVLDTTPQLYALTTAPAPQLVADLRPVTFIDCSGLALLVDIRSRVLASGGRFTMVCADPRVLRLLRITGLDEVLTPVPSPDGPRQAAAGAADGEATDRGRES